MTMSKRHQGVGNGEGSDHNVAIVDGGDGDEKLQKGVSKSKAVLLRALKPAAWLASSFIFAHGLHAWHNSIAVTGYLAGAKGDSVGNSNREDHHEGGWNRGSMAQGLKGGDAGTSSRENNELYPFLASLDAPPRPLPFPIIPRLEGCALTFKPAERPRAESRWRSTFWMPAFPGSGAHDPSRQESLLKEITHGLVLGNLGGDVNPVKNYHVAVPGKLRRCRGVSETVGCTGAHPMTSTSPEKLRGSFRPGAILAVRNPAVAIPLFFAYKNMAYHGGAGQASEEEWRKMRDEHWESAFADWMAILKFWRGTDDAANHYHTALYVPYEDLVTTDGDRGAAAVRQLADLLSDRHHAGYPDPDAFETSSSHRDHECVWYHAARREWEHQQRIVKDYVPAYTRAQRDKMVNEMRGYAAEVQAAPRRGGDAALASLLGRYADQIEAFVRVEKAWGGRARK